MTFKINFIYVLLLCLLTNNYGVFMINKTNAKEQVIANRYLIISENDADQILNNYKLFPKNLEEKYNFLKNVLKITTTSDNKQLKIIPNYPFIQNNELFTKVSTNKYIILTDVNNTELDSITVYISVIFKFLQNLLPNKELFNDQKLINTVNIIKKNLQLDNTEKAERLVNEILTIFIKNKILEQDALQIISDVKIQNFIINKSFSWYMFPMILLTPEYKNLVINQRFEESKKTPDFIKHKNYLIAFAKKSQEELTQWCYNSYFNTIEIDKKQALSCNYNALFKDYFIELQNYKINNQTLSQIFTEFLTNVKEREENAFVIRFTNNSSNIIKQYFEENNSLNIGINDECTFLTYQNHAIKFSNIYKMDKTKTEQNSINLFIELIKTINGNTIHNMLYYNGDSIEDLHLTHLINKNLKNIQIKDQVQKITLRLYFNKLVHNGTKDELFKKTEDYIIKNKLDVPFVVIDENLYPVLEY